MDAEQRTFQAFEAAGWEAAARAYAEATAAMVAIETGLADMLAPFESGGTWRVPATAFIVAADRIR